jgi:hypothetical protein
MTISLRPNNRASRDQTPGPRQTTETAITADNADVIGVTTDSALVFANQENPATTATTVAPRATYRVNSLAFRQRQINSSEVGQITLMSPGDIIFLYSDGVYDGSDKEACAALERIVRDHKRCSAKDICNAVLNNALEQDDYLKRSGEADRVDDKTAFIIKH